MGASRPSGIASTKSRAWATSSASHSSSSVALGLPYLRLLATVPVNRYGFCGTRPMRVQSIWGSRSRTSTPSTDTVPDVASNSRGTRETSVVFPDPVLPMTAVVCPATARNEMPDSTGAAAPG